MSKNVNGKKLQQKKPMTLTQRLWVCAGVAVIGVIVVAVALWWDETHQVPEEKLVDVYFVHDCPCVFEWVKELKSSGFIVREFEPESLRPMRHLLHTPETLHGCHVGEFMGYFLEGHVEPEVLRRLAVERPPMVGVASGDAMVEFSADSPEIEPPQLIDQHGEFHPWVPPTSSSRPPREEMQL